MRRRAGAVALILVLAIPALPGAAKTPTPIEPLDRIAFLPVEVDPSTPPIYERIARPSYAPRPAVDQPTAKVETRSLVTPRPSVKRSGRSISGRASWYCSPAQPVCARGYPPGSFVAAAGPQLRVAMGGGYSVNAPQPWKGKTVTVCGNGCVRVKLVDWCQCYWKQSHEKLIDLYSAPFQTTGGNVTVSW